MIRKTVIITGAASGIGFECAKNFALAGYNLALTFNKRKIDLACPEFQNVSVKTYKLDIKDSQQVGRVVAQIFKDFDYVDCLVANAGIAEKEKMLIDRTDDEIKNILDTDLFGTIICNREVLKYFIKQKHGNIVNIASINGQTGSSCAVTYSSAKAGVIALTKSLAKEVSPIGIRVNCICPGFISTSMTSEFSEKEVEYLKKYIPLKRAGLPEEVSSVAVFLASNNSSYITGAEISVTGGAVSFG